MRFLHEDCDPELADNKKLPNNSFIVEYLEEDIPHFDIVQAMKKVEIFDHYWDNYRDKLKNIKQTAGSINPKLWNPENITEKNK